MRDVAANAPAADITLTDGEIAELTRQTRDLPPVTGLRATWDVATRRPL
ncbi:MAG: hypothetical protein WCF12_03105 [Propionicimonas sp.]